MIKRRRKSVKRSVRRTRRLPATMKATPRRRRRVRRLSAMGGNMTAIITQAGMALAGGVLGKVLRNAMPDTFSPEIKAGATAAAGVVLATMVKQPLVGAGVIGSAGAYYAATLGARLGIPLLSAEETNFVRLAEAQIYADENGNTLKRIGNQFFYPNGALSVYTPNDFKSIN